MLRPFIVKVSILGYFPLHYIQEFRLSFHEIAVLTKYIYL